MIKERVENIQKALPPHSAALIASIPNRLYVTGFESSDGYVLITPDAAYFLIDFRYCEKAKQVVKSCEVRLLQRAMSEIAELCGQHAVTTLYVETGSTSMSQVALYRRSFEGVTVSDEALLDDLLTEMRRLKTAGEVELIKKAQEMTDRTFSYILDRIEAGRTERDVMLDMEFYMRRLGSEGVSFDFIVVSGKNSSLPHGVPTDKKIEKGDFVTMDFGAVAGGYHSDMTRTVAVGGVSPEQEQVYNTVLKAQLAALDAVRPGIVCKDVDKVARDIIYGAGYEGRFGHGLGHGVGVEIHEAPNFNTRCETILREGAIMTVEPGIYLEDKFGVRIEDMVWVTKDGCENLTASEKKLLIV